MMQDTIIKNAVEYINELFGGNSDGHDALHTLRVYKNMKLIAQSYPEADLFIMSLSALLHDADDHKLFKTENNANARSFLAKNDVPEESIEQICEIINGVSFSKNRGKTPETLEGKIVQDADRLDAIGARGIARTFAYGGKVGRSLDDSVQHFYDKLLLLMYEMNTDAAKEIAKARHEYMEGFLKEYYEESRWD